MAYDPIPQKNEDDASGNADAGVVILAIRKATPANTSGTDGDYETLQVSGGRLWASIVGNLTNNNAVPGANNVGVLAALANAAAPTLTEGDQVLQSADLSGNQRVTLGTKLDNGNDSITAYDHGATYANISASTNVLSGAGHLRGIFVASASATPTIKIWDNTTAATPILVNTFTPVAGTMYTFPNIRVSTGIFVTISGTVDCTVFYDNVTS